MNGWTSFALREWWAAPVVRDEYETGGSVEWCDFRSDLVDNLEAR